MTMSGTRMRALRRLLRPGWSQLCQGSSMSVSASLVIGRADVSRMRAGFLY
jgi:hypothetical protein